MIAPPLNDQECLGKLTDVAVQGQQRPDVRDLARRFRTTGDLARWIRSLPQRDDAGVAADGPRVQCEVSQRARLLAADPNCVERSILYLAVGELLDATKTRRLATIDTPLGRHTFPVENGEPVVLDPPITRNALLAGLWHIRNADSPVRAEAIRPAPLLGWLLKIAEEPAAHRHGRGGLARVRRARGAFARLLGGRWLSPGERADALYVLRMAGDAAPLFGETGLFGLRVARGAVAQLLAQDTTRNLRISPERAVYWSGKAIATYYGLGGLYEPAYAEVARRPKPATPPPNQPPAGAAPAGPPAAHPTAPAGQIPAEKGVEPTRDVESWTLDAINANGKE